MGRYGPGKKWWPEVVALVPRPSVNLTRFHSVFAPNSKYRARVTLASRGKRKEIHSPNALTHGKWRLSLLYSTKRILVAVPDLVSLTCTARYSFGRVPTASPCPQRLCRLLPLTGDLYYKEPEI